MALKLRVISDQYKTLGAQRSRMFGVTGGTIGRGSDNDWVLPDTKNFISGRHATVTYRAGCWLLEDVSRNGVFLNDNDVPLADIGPAKLTDGDRLRLGEYDVLVSIDERADFSPDVSGQMPIPSRLRERAAPNRPLPQSASPKLGRAKSKSAPPKLELDSLLKSDLEVTDLLIPARRHPAKRDSLSNSASIQLHASGFGGASEALKDFCRGLGVEPDSLPARAQSAILTSAGQLLRETAVQLTRSLQRQADRVENELNPSGERTAANPVSAPPPYESTIYRLLEASNPHGLTGVEVLRDSFERMRDQEDAFDAAIAVAVAELLARIEPARIAARSDQSGTSSLFGTNKKEKYWELFSEVFAAIEQRDDRGWPTLLAREFAKALTAQMRDRQRRQD